MITCIVVDDEPLARLVLENHISRMPELHLLGKYANAVEAFEAIANTSPDLIFLDIKMPVLSGIDFIKSLKNPPAVIFTTAFPEYGADSYELEAVDYLLKPVTYERLAKSISRFQRLQDKTPESAYSYFKVNGKLLKIEHQDILLVQSIRDYLLLKTVNGNYIIHMTMKAVCDLLPQAQFRRVHRSYLVNLSHLTVIGKNEVYVGDIRIPVGGHYKGKLPDLTSLR
jgi:DNA-binding LytR/AlgR family response regulator